jgi:hypothetical protein
VDEPQNIINSFPDKLYAAKAKDMYHLLKEFRADPSVASCYAFGEYLHVTLREKEQDGVDLLNKLASKNNAQDFEAKSITPTIEDSFIRLMMKNETAVA